MRFEFIAGSPSLCLVDTIGDRGGAGVERLRNAGDLVDWLKAAKLLESDDFMAGLDDLRAARKLREAIYRCARTAIAGAAMDQADIAVINRWAARPPSRPQLVGDMIALTAERPVEGALSILAADAILVLAAGQRKRIRACPECHMIFFDTSRPGRRRWCSSESGCGNRAKSRNYRARKGAASQGIKSQ